MKTTSIIWKSILFVLLGTAMTSNVRAQGALNPPASPAPTMRTLGQIYTAVTAVEPRTPISSLPFTIDTAGSYYLTGSLTGVSGTNGITITCDNVTVDLDGHALIGGAGTVDGIYVDASPLKRNVCVKNGQVFQWEGDGVNVRYAYGARVQDVLVCSNGVLGIYVGDEALVRDCVVTYSGNKGIQGSYDCMFQNCISSRNGNDGIYIFNGGVIEQCTTYENAGHGFYASYAAVDQCTARANDGSGFTLSGCKASGCESSGNGGHGFWLFNENNLLNSVAYNNATNGVSGADSCNIIEVTSYYNGDNGILVEEGCIVRDCIVRFNSGDGIEAVDECRVVNNLCDDNGRSTGDGAGIYITGYDNRIENNTVTDADRGIQVDGTGNFIVKNTASGNSSDFAVVGGNTIGPIDTSSSGTITNMSPWANFEF